MTLGQLINTIMDNSFMKYSALFFILHEDWIFMILFSFESVP